MAQTKYYVSRDIRLRIGSGIWIDRKRWGKKNDINIPLIQGEEREQLLGKRSRLKALTDLLEQEINTAPDKSAITREYMQGVVKRFHKPTKAKKEHEKSFFDVIDTSPESYTSAGVRRLFYGRRQGNRHLRNCALPSSSGPSLLAQLLVGKYQDHLPLHRQIGILARIGEVCLTVWGGSAEADRRQEVLQSPVKRAS